MVALSQRDDGIEDGGEAQASASVDEGVLCLSISCMSGPQPGL